MNGACFDLLFYEVILKNYRVEEIDLVDRDTLLEIQPQNISSSGSK